MYIYVVLVYVRDRLLGVRMCECESVCVVVFLFPFEYFAHRDVAAFVSDVGDLKMNQIKVLILISYPLGFPFLHMI